ncbi:GNAT family N-acetyltransferase [Streptomyces sp. NRRL F-5650]|uniref:GNAT family N-acetyltransferase n=1 Tax=Streptomyces sp. NRRL F-5650 TaxID=1463868 RepID=UPI0004C657CE|nr:GNAT family N-acetyltransferase [Streptomyces sp. NRRL F-5650]
MTAIDDMDYEFRTARPDDTEAIKALDGSFTTRTVFQVALTEHGFALQEVPVHPPIHKVFPAEDTHDAHTSVAEGDPHSRTFVAVGTDGSLAGFTSVSYASWNRRLAVEDIEVAPTHRGRGVGRALIGHAVEFAGECGAGHIWLEVTNINAPAIHAYQRMGFTFCGLDTTLYDGTPASGEHALYMSMPCPVR